MIARKPLLVCPLSFTAKLLHHAGKFVSFAHVYHHLDSQSNHCEALLYPGTLADLISGQMLELAQALAAPPPTSL